MGYGLKPSYVKAQANCGLWRGTVYARNKFITHTQCLIIVFMLWYDVEIVKWSNIIYIYIKNQKLYNIIKKSLKI